MEDGSLEGGKWENRLIWKLKTLVIGLQAHEGIMLTRRDILQKRSTEKKRVEVTVE
jgi:hypothetical protein